MCDQTAGDIYRKVMCKTSQRNIWAKIPTMLSWFWLYTCSMGVVFQFRCKSGVDQLKICGGERLVTIKIIYIVSTADPAGVYRCHGVVLLRLDSVFAKGRKYGFHAAICGWWAGCLAYRCGGRLGDGFCSVLFSFQFESQIWLLWLGASTNICKWGETARVIWVWRVSSRGLAGGRFGVLLSREWEVLFCLCWVVCAWDQHEGLV